MSKTRTFSRPNATDARTAWLTTIGSWKSGKRSTENRLSDVNALFAVNVLPSSTYIANVAIVTSVGTVCSTSVLSADSLNDFHRMESSCARISVMRCMKNASQACVLTASTPVTRSDSSLVRSSACAMPRLRIWDAQRVIFICTAI